MMGTLHRAMTAILAATWFWIAVIVAVWLVALLAAYVFRDVDDESF